MASLGWGLGASTAEALRKAAKAMGQLFATALSPGIWSALTKAVREHPEAFSVGDGAGP